jgi:DNA polymerase-1
VTPTELPYEEIWLRDFEFISRPGEPPDVVCLVAHELRSGRTLRLWLDELNERPPYRTDSKVLLVSFVANAECACHLALGWPLPANELDLSPAFRNSVNGRLTPEGKGLLGALRYFGFSNVDQKLKDAMRDRIIQGWPFTPEEQQKILNYCAGDVDDLLRLLARMLPEIDLKKALHWGEWAVVSALMEHRGVPMDMEVFVRLADDDSWRRVRDAMVPTIDAQYGVYVHNAAADWSFNMERFTTYLAHTGILDNWPRLASGKLDMRRKTFDSMAKAWPQLEDLRQLRFTRDKLRKIKLAVGADGRNRTVLWPFTLVCRAYRRIKEALAQRREQRDADYDPLFDEEMAEFRVCHVAILREELRYLAHLERKLLHAVGPPTHTMQYNEKTRKMEDMGPSDDFGE